MEMSPQSHLTYPMEQGHPPSDILCSTDISRKTMGLGVGGPAPKMKFFQLVQKSFLSVPIYCSWCIYDSLDFFFQKYCLEPAH